MASLEGWSFTTKLRPLRETYIMHNDARSFPGIGHRNLTELKFWGPKDQSQNISGHSIRVLLSQFLTIEGLICRLSKRR